MAAIFAAYHGGDVVIAAGLSMLGGTASVSETAAELRHRAAHVRWLLGELSDLQAQHSLEELEARAAELEPDQARASAVPALTRRFDPSDKQKGRWNAA